MIHPAVRDLFLSLNRHPAFQDVARSLAGGGRASLAGLTGTAKALYAVLLWQAVERPLAIVTASSRQAESLFEAIETFFNLLVPQGSRPAPLLLPAFDALPGQGLAPHADIGEQRAAGLWRLASQPVPITVLPAASALVKLESADFYRQLALTLAVNDEVPLEDVVRHLESAGYERREPVEMAGEFSLRGGILDVFSPEDAKPVRIDFFGDLVESMRRFDVESQRSVLKIERATLLPLLEYPKSEALLGELRERLRGGEAAGWQLVVPLVRPRQQAVFDLLENGAVIWDEPEQCRSAAERLFQRLAQVGAPEPEAIFFTWEELAGRAGGAGRAQLEMRELSLDPSAGAIRTRPSMAFRGNVKIAMAEARTLVESGHRVAFFTASMGELERLADIFNEYGLAYQLGLEQSEHTPGYLAERAYLAGSVASIYLVRGNIRRGAIFSDSALAVIGSQDLFDASELGAAPAKSHRAAFSTDLFDLKPGDYVVHVEHGVGRFLGVREIAQGENRGDYMLIEYAAGAKLYLPLTRMDLIERFHGSGEAAPALDRMGGITWQRTKSRVKAKMRDMAEELLKLYAARKLTPGFASSSDSNWQREFEDAFEFSETPDQLTAIRDLKRDMESPEPMDRLICGDVGFGKTEVAMRAAFKILGDGKQVAVLAPTTVLAFQHFETFRRRFQQFPVRVEMLSRFRTPKEIAAVLADLAEGKLDIAIGTHRLLSKDVVFKDLGLLIVDEEQRFGVRHKERLKQMQKGVDVVSMSATPIPRTLHMSLAGLRDMSVIETPPKDRLAIHTVVTHSSPELIRSAIELELGRGGQVYFLHNRVDSIWARAAMIQELLPEARIGVGHGQMSEAQLERTMLAFMRHEFDILVSTTIIENGLDIPLANTIIIENAERYGLSELYQLRGRVGRSNRRAYAYLLAPPDSELTELARKRLAALKEFSDLGAGFKIAALDLELRGAGNLLGGEQHGHINTVGFDTYIRMLEETVRELKGEEVPVEIHSALNLGLDIRIPPEYIADENQRLRVYRQISSAAEPAARDRIAQELRDRYGAPPEPVEALLEYSALKSAAEKLGVERIDRRHNLLQLKFHQRTRVQPEKLMDLVRRTPGVQFTPAGILILPLDGMSAPRQVLQYLGERLAEMAGAA